MRARSLTLCLFLTLGLLLAGTAKAQTAAATAAGTLVVGSTGNRIAGSGRTVDDMRTPGAFSAIRSSSVA